MSISPSSRTSFAARRSARSTSPSDLPRIPDIDHRDAVRALQKAGFEIVRHGRHVVMWNGTRIPTIPRHDPVNAFTLEGIVRDAGLTVEQFRDLL
jgi:predicted RNA binding protein YcfA (HicA-like mRNA interferase family)